MVKLINLFTSITILIKLSNKSIFKLSFLVLIYDYQTIQHTY